jgi:hypothetical protein
MRQNSASACGTLLLLTIAACAQAQDIKLQPVPGSGVVVTDSAGGAERLRINENGPVLLPGLAEVTSPAQTLCRNTTTSQVGTCPTGNSPGIVQICQSGTRDCGVVGGCDIDEVFKADCPAGYMRLSYNCRKADDIGVTVTTNDDPTQNGFGCRYKGHFSVNTLGMGIRMLCVQHVGVACYQDP